MSRILKYLAYGGALLLLLAVAYGAKGYFDALHDADGLRQRADRLIAAGLGGSDLGPGRLDILLKVQDPAFAEHAGVDFTTAGAGATTVTQSLSKRLAFDRFRPGIGKIRQTGYALGLERRLDKAQIMALWLDTLEMGRGPNGWMTGFYRASEAIFKRPPAALTEDEFLRLVAVLIAPANYDLRGENTALDDRVERIKRLVAAQCAPMDHGDVWLEGCR